MHSWITVIIVAIIVSGLVKIFASRRDERLGVVRDEDGNPVHHPRDLRDSELKREIERLHERIRVLERIATDANTSDARKTAAIAEEIERLRDR